jgi:hypothetical protein
VVQPLISKRAASDGQRNEECIRPQVVPDVEAMISGVLAEADQRSRFLVSRGSKDARPPRRQQQEGVQSGPAGRFDQGPAVDETLISEPFDPSLGHAPAGEEESFDLIAIEVPVIGKGDQDRNVSSGERSHELGDLLLSKTSNGVAGEITKKKWTTE